MQVQTYNFVDMQRPVPLKSRFAQPGYHVWGGSMVRDEQGLCHLFYARWPYVAGHRSWVSHSEIARAVSHHPLGPYRFVDVAVAGRGGGFWDADSVENPTVKRFGKKYYLYYTGNFGDKEIPTDEANLNWTHRNNQRIGIAVAEHPAGPWERFEHPVIDVSPNPDYSDSLCVCNPAVTEVPGGYLMVYKSVGRKRPLPFGGPVVHRAAVAEKPEGPFIKYPDDLFTVEGVDFPAEDPFVWYNHRDGHYYAIVKDMGGFFTRQGISLALLCSSNGFDWEPASNVLVSDLNIRWENGFQPVSRLERPQVWFENGKPSVLFLAAAVNHQESFNVHIPLREE